MCIKTAASLPSLEEAKKSYFKKSFKKVFYLLLKGAKMSSSELISWVASGFGNGWTVYTCIIIRNLNLLVTHHLWLWECYNGKDLHKHLIRLLPGSCKPSFNVAFKKSAELIPPPCCHCFQTHIALKKISEFNSESNC